MPKRYHLPLSSQELSQRARRGRRRSEDHADERATMQPWRSSGYRRLPHLRGASRRMASRSDDWRREDDGEREGEALGALAVAPVSRPVEMVAPEREKPRNGRQRPCTAPIHPACAKVTFSPERERAVVVGWLWRRLRCVPSCRPRGSAGLRRRVLVRRSPGARRWLRRQRGQRRRLRRICRRLR